MVRCVEQHVTLLLPTLGGSSQDDSSTYHSSSSSFKNMHWVFSGFLTFFASGISILIGFIRFFTSISVIKLPSFLATKALLAARAEMLT